MGWVGTTALAMGGSNQSLFLIGALIIGQGSIAGQGTAAIPLLVIGLALGWMAAPGWTELVLMWPNRVGGIAATCGEAFRPYAPVLANLTGISYWWGWVPTCGLTALLSASAINQWYLPGVPVPVLACGIIAVFTGINLCGVGWASRLALPIATASATLAFLSAIIPVFAGRVYWHQALTFHLTVPFPGVFGKITSAMAGLYLVGFAAPAFEAAACHVGETRDPAKNVPRAMFAGAVMATLYFLVLPVIWLGAIGQDDKTGLAGDLAQTLGPTYAPLLGSLAKSAAIWFMMFNMFHGTLAPLTGVARTLSQLAEDELLPEFFAWRNRFDCPWVAIVITAACAVVFLLIGDPVWLVAAANFTYLIGIALPNVAVWLLRRDQPDMPRPYRAPRGTIMLGLIAAVIWGISTILGFEQFGLPTVLFGLLLAYSGAGLYAWRKWSDRRKSGVRGVARSLHLKLTGAMLLVLTLDGFGYLMAVRSIQDQQTPLVTALQDVFVAVAILTITVGLVLPGMIAHSAAEVSKAAARLATGTLADFSRAMEALSAGNLDAAHARVDYVPVIIHSRDEVGEMAANFNVLQKEVARAATGLSGAREGLRAARSQLTAANVTLERRVIERTEELSNVHRKLVDAAWQAGMAEVAIGVLHNVGNVLNSVNASASTVDHKVRNSKLTDLGKVAEMLRAHESDLGRYISSDPAGRKLPAFIGLLADYGAKEQSDLIAELTLLHRNIDHIKEIVTTQQRYAKSLAVRETVSVAELVEDAVRINALELSRKAIRLDRRLEPGLTMSLERHRAVQVLVNLISNAKFALDQVREDRRVIAVTTRRTGAGIAIDVTDHGVGILPENMPRIFEHGFTTRRDGHGFGLHSSSLAAKMMGGTLAVRSDGPGQGATFTLELPIDSQTSMKGQMAA
jgi:amino acid transporter/signal transduction histidine kinase